MRHVIDIVIAVAVAAPITHSGIRWNACCGIPEKGSPEDASLAVMAEEAMLVNLCGGV
jgi:hypothetical protein